ncbi:MAG: hypothetical protein R6U17_01990, partial [Thermoplasmata archaeon]
APTQVGYSWHYEMKKSGWDSGDLRKDGNHPKVYVEKGGHASNFKPGITESESDYPTRLDNNDYTIRPITNENWLNFKGKWGEDSGSPNGPVFRYSKTGTAPFYGGKLAHMWLEPLFWHQHTNHRSI